MDKRNLLCSLVIFLLTVSLLSSLVIADEGGQPETETIETEIGGEIVPENGDGEAELDDVFEYVEDEGEIVAEDYDGYTDSGMPEEDTEPLEDDSADDSTDDDGEIYYSETMGLKAEVEEAIIGTYRMMAFLVYGVIPLLSAAYIVRLFYKFIMNTFS